MNTNQPDRAGLMPLLRGEILPAIKELLAYSETVRLPPGERHGLTTRIEAIYYDLDDALGSGTPLLLFPAP